MAKRKKPEKDANRDLDGPLWLQLQQQAQKYLSPEKVSEMLETQDLIHLMLRDTITQDLAQAGIVYSPLEHLEELTRLFLRHWEDNREHLIKTGHPLTYLRLGIWFPFYSHRLYPTKSLKLDLAKSLNFYRQLYGRGSQSVSGENNQGPDKLANTEVAFSYEWINQDGICEYDKASITNDINPDEADRLQASRVTLFELRIQILKLLLKAVQRRSPDDLWKNCLSLLTDTITYQDATFFLNMDEIFRESSGFFPPIGGDIYTAGGLDDLLTIIGRYELELISGDMTKVYTILQKLWEYQQRKGLQVRIPDYFEEYGQPLQSILDEAADMYLATSRGSREFWQEYDQRVNEALENEFYEEIIIRKKVKRKLVHKYESKVDMFAEGTIAWLERTGTFPELILTQPEPPPKKEENAFILKGEYWMVTYQGDTTNVKDSTGMRYIAHLLDNPDKKLHVLDLIKLVKKPVTGESDFSRYQIGDVKRKKRENADDKTIQGDFFDISYRMEEPGENLVDNKSISQLKERLEDITEELKDAEKFHDIGRINDLKEEQAQILNYLNSSLGLYGKSRKAVRDHDRARISIQKAISKSLQNLSKMNLSLEIYLRNRINTGTFCSYNPDPDNPISFKVKI